MCFPWLQLLVPIKRAPDATEGRAELPSWKMKSLFACLFLGVSLALAVGGPSPIPELSQYRDRNVDPGPNYCCFDFTKRPIPLNLLKSFEYTNGRCSKPAVVFITKRGVKICADPSEEWVQDRIRHLSPS